jgi:hypothetical protein
VREDPFDLVEQHREQIVDRFEGWELIEFLQISAEDVLDAIKEFGWVDYDNVDDVLDFIGVRDVR